jgi:LysM repeat protein
MPAPDRRYDRRVVRFSFLVSSLMAVALAGTVLAAAVMVGLVPTGPASGPTSTPAPASQQASQPTPTESVTEAPSPTVPPTAVPPSAGGTYVVQVGDTLTGIADAVGVPWELIAQANNIQGPDYIIQVGQILTIPVPPTTSPDANTYVVKEGDTITAIALQFGVDASDLADYNNIANWDDIKVGQVLYIPGPGWTPLPTQGH